MSRYDNLLARLQAVFEDVEVGRIGSNMIGQVGYVDLFAALYLAGDMERSFARQNGMYGRVRGVFDRVAIAVYEMIHTDSYGCNGAEATCDLDDGLAPFIEAERCFVRHRGGICIVIHNFVQIP